MLAGFIDKHRDRFGGVEPICRTLTESGCRIAPSTYYAMRTRPASARAVRDEWLRTQIAKVQAASAEPRGAERVWRQLQKDGLVVARCTVERLMRAQKSFGGGRGSEPPALVWRWFADARHIPTQAGAVFVCFAVDGDTGSIVGWAGATALGAGLVLDAWELGLRRCGRKDPDCDGRGRRAPSRPRHIALAVTGRLADEGVAACAGVHRVLRADSADSADSRLDAAMDAYLLACAGRRLPWETPEQVFLATAGWVGRYNATLPQRMTTPRNPGNRAL